MNRGTTAWQAITDEIGPYNAPAESDAAPESDAAEAPPSSVAAPAMATSPDLPLIAELEEREVSLILAYQNAQSEAEAESIWDELEGVREEIADEMMYAAANAAGESTQAGDETYDNDEYEYEELPDFHVDGAPDSEFAEDEMSEANRLTKDEAEALGLKEWVQGFAIALSLLTGHGETRPAGQSRQEAEKIEEAGHERKKRKNGKKGGGGKGGSGGRGGGRGGGSAGRGAAGRSAGGRVGASRAGGSQAMLVQLSWEAGYATGRAVAQAAGEEEYYKGVDERTYMSDAEFERRMREANPLPFLPPEWPRWFDWY